MGERDDLFRSYEEAVRPMTTAQPETKVAVRRAWQRCPAPDMPLGLERQRSPWQALLLGERDGLSRSYEEAVKPMTTAQPETGDAVRGAWQGCPAQGSVTICPAPMARP